MNPKGFFKRFLEDPLKGIVWRTLLKKNSYRGSPTLSIWRHPKGCFRNLFCVECTFVHSQNHSFSIQTPTVHCGVAMWWMVRDSCSTTPRHSVITGIVIKHSLVAWIHTSTVVHVRLGLGPLISALTKMCSPQTTMQFLEHWPPGFQSIHTCFICLTCSHVK
jgi:hypothetical protein